jgi:hypothetical protein
MAMSRTALSTASVLSCLLLLSCANPYQTARSTVTIGRGALTATGVGFSTYMKVEQDKCLDKCKQDKACYDACMKNPNDIWAKWDQSRELAKVVFDTADTSIAVAEKLGKKEPVDWLPLVKNGACLIAKSLGFLPKETKEKIQGLIDLIGNFGCK